ncbi:hypothetical protein Micau_6144 [Micromonospora aurantiaca ATCC 27029]|nr:hypothetical protein Micau_6144 [Micromonospora aurantiaca ATCC 27029]
MRDSRDGRLGSCGKPIVACHGSRRAEDALAVKLSDLVLQPHFR